MVVTPVDPSIALGLTQQFTVTGTYTDASTADLTGLVAWESHNTAVATVDAAGLVTSLTAGTAVISVAPGEIGDYTTLTVTPAELASMVVTPVDPSIALGLTQQFTVTGTYTDASTADLTGLVTWESHNTAVATVDAAGLVTSLTAGTAVISVALGEIGDYTTLTVTPPATYTLSGTLTAGTPHDGSTVHLLSAAGDYLGNTATSGGGLYSFTVSPGDYVLWIQPNLAGYPDQYYDGVPDFASATPIAVAGDTVQDITLTGPPATYTLSGTLTAGTPHDGSTVHLLSAAGDYLGNTATSGGGLYSFTVSPGDYVLWIQPNLAGYPDQYYDGVPDFASATPIAVAGDTVQDITLTGPPATYTLSGTLTAGTPHDGSTVHLLSAAGDYLGNTATSGGGSYSFTVSPGDYVLWIQPNLAGYPDQYYDGVPDFASATPIAVAGDTVQDITLTGPPATYTLSGTLTAGTPHDGSTVHLLSAAGDYLGNTATSGGGSYSFTVSPGDYVLWIQPNLAGYPDQYYDGVPDFASATPIAVAGDTVQDITLTGPPATYTLSGTLTAGTPHDGSTVHLLSAAGDYLGNTATSGGGPYSFTVSPGYYVLWIQPNLAGYPDQYYDGVPDFASATPIAVAGDTVQDITLTGP